jgi:hypothetical protein
MPAHTQEEGMCYMYVWKLNYQRAVVVLIIVNLVTLLLLAGPGYVSPVGGIAPRLQPVIIIATPTVRAPLADRNLPERQARPEPTATAIPLPTEAPPAPIAAEPVVIYVEIPAAPTVAPPPLPTEAPSWMVLHVEQAPAPAADDFVASFEAPAGPNPFIGCVTAECRAQWGSEGAP